ncbi:MAG: S1/P1 Nuclease [Bacteroidetes bacterium]|nr:S1/P1 Nuclease [Bacteroidota bacterium]
MLRISLLLFFSCFLVQSAKAWGFWAHQRINRIAVFTLPIEMIVFYKENIEYLTEHAVDPDKRRYAIEGEAPRHFIDLDHFCIYPCDDFPKTWYDAKERYSEDTLNAYGTVPWTIEWMMNSLTRAFEEGNKAKILKYSADIGHYIGDSHVPLHTTENYNGQLTDQYGIHGFWESRLPELFNEDYDYFVGSASYIEDRNSFIWGNVLHAHWQLEAVLLYEKELDALFPPDQKFSYEARGTSLVRAYSFAYSEAYHKKLEGMVEAQMQLSIKHVGDIWYTCWVNAGSPDLSKLEDMEFDDEEAKQLKENYGKIKSRSHAETGSEIISD